MKTLNETRGSRGGFSLIELLAVLVILSILMVFLIPRLGGAEDAVRSSKTEAFLARVGVALEEFEQDTGDYPASTFTKEQGTPPNGTNTGAEALFVNLWAEGFDGLGMSADNDLGNSDGDSSRSNLTTLGTRSLFELKDAWDNPIAYFHKNDYGKQQSYLCWDPETGEELPDNKVSALESEKTGRPYNPNKFQLISAGSDGIFGTDDDITNFQR